MKKLMKQQKGFSLVELLIALLIMAIIAGTAITLFGGVLETSRGGADRETADAIKRAILTYMNASNDSNLSALGVTNGSASANLVTQLAAKTTISGAAATTPTSDPAADAAVKLVKDSKDLNGVYGPFLEEAKVPEQDKMVGWAITVEMISQKIKVEATDSTAKAIVTLVNK